MAVASALATLDVIERERLVENATKVGTHLLTRLRELQAKHQEIGDVPGPRPDGRERVRPRRGDMTPNVPFRDRVVEEIMKRGLVLLPCGKSSIRYIPPLVITDEEIDEAIEIIDAAIRRRARRDEGRPAHPPGTVVGSKRSTPRHGPGEVVVALAACGVCGTDLEKLRGNYRTAGEIGHEPVGVVDAVGEGVPGLSKGDRVFVHHHVPCYKCPVCARGDPRSARAIRPPTSTPAGSPSGSGSPRRTSGRGRSSDSTRPSTGTPPPCSSRRRTS